MNNKTIREPVRRMVDTRNEMSAPRKRSFKISFYFRLVTIIQVKSLSLTDI